MPSVRSCRVLALACAFVTISSLARHARAQEPLPFAVHSELALPNATPQAAPPGRVERLETALLELSDTGNSGAIWNLVGGAAWVALGTWVLVAHKDEEKDPSSIEVGTISLATGASLMAAGVYGLSGPASAGERRFERWKALRAQGKLDADMLARFEGELAAEAAAARAYRHVGAVSSIGFAAGGAGVIGLAAAEQVAHGSQWFAYLLGGTMVALGTLQAIIKFSGSSAAEDVWRRYQSGARTAFARRAPNVSVHASSNCAQVFLAGRY